MLDHLLKHPTGLFHLTTALAALIFGIRIIFTAKGTLKHRWLGWGYLGSMILLNCSALLIYELKGTFGVFHWLALISLFTLMAGYLPVLLKPNGWLRQHAYFMAGSYIGLLAATSAEIASRIPGWAFESAVFISSMLINILGIAIMLWKVPGAIRRKRSA
jgi:uncharacterized membrane protein